MSKEELETSLYAAAYIGGGLITGLLFEYLLLKQLIRFTSKTKWRSDDILFRSLKGLSIIWFAAAGIFLATRSIDLPKLISISDKVLVSVIILSLAVFCARAISGFITMQSEEASGTKNPAASIITNIVRISIFIIGILTILQYLGISIAPILTALGVGGLAVALALQDTLSNLFSGIQVVASKQIRKGDYIKLSSGEEGYVEDVSWRNTSIRMLTNNLIIVPNSKISTLIITNFNLPEKEMIVILQAGVSYDSDLEFVEKVTILAAKETLQKTNGGVKDFEPLVRFHTFENSSITFNVILRAYEFADQNLIKHEFVKILHRRYKENNIEIPFPIQTVYLKNKS